MNTGLEDYIDLIVQAPIVAMLLLFILLTYRIQIQALKLISEFLKEALKILKKEQS